MSGFNGAPRRFRVDRLTAVITKTEQLFQEAEETGRGSEFASALRQIVATLRNRAREAGELMWVLPNAKMEVRIIVQRPASVRFAVHQSAMEVVILDIVLMGPN